MGASQLSGKRPFITDARRLAVRSLFDSAILVFPAAVRGPVLKPPRSRQRPSRDRARPTVGEPRCAEGWRLPSRPCGRSQLWGR
jgi:hypothetical protein